jgi:predicted ester cyclase
MSIDENKALIRRIPEKAFSQGKLEVLDEVLTPDYIEHVPLPPGVPAGIEGLKVYIRQLRSAFPDFRYTIEDEIAEGDKVVQRVTAQGTQKGEFLGIPATGKHVTWDEIHISRVAGGKSVEHWAVQNLQSLMQQLGAIPKQG